MTTFYDRVGPGILVALALSLGLLLVPLTMGVFWEDSATALTIATVGQVLRPYTALPITSVLVGLVAAWAPGGLGARVVAGGLAAAFGQLMLTIAGWLGLKLALSVWSIPEVALGGYQDVADALPMETFLLLPAAFVVGALAAFGVHRLAPVPDGEDLELDEEPRRRIS